MTIELPGNMEEQLRNLAARKGRPPGALVEQAVREYLEAASITDLDPAAVAEAQVTLAAEIDLRLAEHDRNPESAIPWKEVRARFFHRFA